MFQFSRSTWCEILTNKRYSPWNQQPKSFENRPKLPQKTMLHFPTTPFKAFYFHPYFQIGNDPIWLIIIFKWGETTKVGWLRSGFRKKLDLFEDPKLEGYMRFQAEDEGGAGEGWKVRIYIDVWLDGGNRANQLIDSLSMFIPLFTVFYVSQVVQDFFHQQYGWMIRFLMRLVWGFVFCSWCRWWMTVTQMILSLLIS